MKRLIVQSLLIASSLGLAETTLKIQSAQAVNIKEWNLQFLNASGEQIGSGNFSYDADKTLSVNSPYNGQLTINNVLETFSANFEDGNQFNLYDRPYYIGERWYEPESKSASSFFNFRITDSWYFVRESDFSNTRVLQLESSSTWSTISNSSIIDSGTWKISSAVPEPLTVLGVGTALGFGILFKQALQKQIKTK